MLNSFKLLMLHYKLLESLPCMGEINDRNVHMYMQSAKLFYVIWPQVYILIYAFDIQLQTTVYSNSHVYYFHAQMHRTKQAQ